MTDIRLSPDTDNSVLEHANQDVDALKEEIRDLCHAWLEVYNYHGDVDVEWTTGKVEKGTCEHDIDYDAVCFTFHLGRIWAESTPFDLKELVAHEVAHIVTWPLCDVAEQLLERLHGEGIATGEYEKWAKDVERATERSTTHVHRAVMRALNAEQ